MDRIKKTITARLLNKLPRDVEFIDPQWLNGYDIPGFLVERIKHELHRNLENSITPPKSVWADMNARPVKEAWQQFIEAIEAETRLPLDMAVNVLETAVNDILNLLVEPRRFMPDYIFGSDKTLDFRQASERVSVVVVYTHFGLHLPNYMQRKQIDVIDRERFSSFMNQLDDKLTSQYSPLNWAQLLSPLFELTNHKIEPDLIAHFFRDKQREDLARRFDGLDESINQSRFIDILTAPYTEHPEEPKTAGKSGTGTPSAPSPQTGSEVSGKSFADAEPKFISDSRTDEVPRYRQESKTGSRSDVKTGRPVEPVQNSSSEDISESSHGIRKTVRAENPPEADDKTSQSDSAASPPENKKASKVSSFPDVTPEFSDGSGAADFTSPGTASFSGNEPAGRTSKDEIEIPESEASTGSQPATISSRGPQPESAPPLWQKFRKNEETGEKPPVTKSRRENISGKSREDHTEHSSDPLWKKFQQPVEEQSDSITSENDMNKIVQPGKNEPVASVSSDDDVRIGNPVMKKDSMKSAAKTPDPNKDSVAVTGTDKESKTAPDSDSDTDHSKTTESGSGITSVTTDDVDTSSKETFNETLHQPSAKRAEDVTPLNERFRPDTEDTFSNTDQLTNDEIKEPAAAEMKSGEQLPMWKRFVAAATGSKSPTASDEHDDKSIADFYTAGDEDYEHDIEISNPLRINEITKTLDSKKKYYINRFFRGDHAAFNTVIRDLAEMDSWNEAGPYITRNVFKKNKIDPYSDEAVNFIDRLQSYFTAQNQP
jgi:hypothetical protein